MRDLSVIYASRDAYKEKYDSTLIIRGINGTELVELVLKYYDQFNTKYRKMIPLKMVYIPVPFRRINEVII